MASLETQFDPTDRELVERFQRGDARAFEGLYARHAKMLVAFIASRASRGFDCENLAQEIWLKIHAELKEFENDNFRAWMLTIARNRLIDDGRKRTVRREHGADEAAFPENFDQAFKALLEDPRLVHL
jgi:RNA polymerase sigma factor (sigma-70 family)